MSSIKGLAGSVAVSTSTAVAILPSGDLARSRAYYAFLGFRVLSETADYLQVELPVDDLGVQLHLYLAPETDACTNANGWYLRTPYPEDLRGKWCADGVDCPEVEVPDSYGPTVFALIDPDGNMLRVGPLMP